MKVTAFLISVALLTSAHASPPETHGQTVRTAPQPGQAAPRVAVRRSEEPPSDKFLRAQRKVPNQYVVVLGGVAPDAVERVAGELVRPHGGSILFVYQYALQGFAVRMSEQGARALSRDERVEYVTEDEVMELSQAARSAPRPDAATAVTKLTVGRPPLHTQTNPPWGLDRINQRDLPLGADYSYYFGGQTAHAYVIDSGIRPTHQQFGGRAGGNGYTAISDGNGTNDCYGHGTHVAGTLGGSTYGVARDARLHSVRVFDCLGGGNGSTVIAGVNWVIANHVKPAVANMSLGGGAYAPLDTAVQNMINAGVTTVVSAGNDNGADACNKSPARLPAAITIGSTTSTDARSSFSNIGTCLDLFAPGSGVLSSWYTSDTATNTLDGTSMAAPHVAGVVAQYLSSYGPDAPLVAPDQLSYSLRTQASQNKLSNVGAGSPNRLLYSLFIDEYARIKKPGNAAQ